MGAALSNARHEAFAQARAAGRTAEEAYAAAGYKPNRGNAARLKANESIARRVGELVAKGAQRAEATVARTLQELARLGFSDIRKAFDKNGNLLPPSAWDDDFAASVASIEVVTETRAGEAEARAKRQPHGRELRRRKGAEVAHIHKIKLWPKNPALDTIAKHLGMLVNRHELTGKDGAPLEARVIIVPPKEKRA